MSDLRSRYVLRELTGYPRESGGGWSHKTTDVYILDSFYGYAVVAHWPGNARGRDSDLPGRRRVATAVLDGLNDDVSTRKGKGSR